MDNRGKDAVPVRKQRLRRIGAVGTLLAAGAICGFYLYQMGLHGGFDGLPEGSPLPSLRVERKGEQAGAVLALPNWGAASSAPASGL